jgi:hypothetical protein
MSTKFHLLLDRSEYTSEDISKLEALLKDYAISEGQTNWQKSSIISLKDTPKDTIEEVWIEEGKFNGENVTFIHWYNELWYIIQTN